MSTKAVSRLYRALLVICALASMGACNSQDGGTADKSSQQLPSEGQLASLPLGDVAGVIQITDPQNIKNPFKGNKQAAAEGQKLFVVMNCAGCHGYDAKGGMGPDLTDAYWRYGGTPGAIYRSIFEGRPQGMPSWGRALPPQEIWKIVSYIETLGGSIEPQLYHAGLQGDHNVTFTAPEIHDLGSAFNAPRMDNPSDGAPPGPPPRGAQ